MTELPKTMKSAASYDYGNYESIKIIEREVPTPGPEQILVKIKASGVTSADSMMRRGVPRFARLFMGLTKPKNKYIGTIFSGEVIGFGEKVNSVSIGDKIFGETGFHFGANAEYAVLDEKGVYVKKPDYLNHKEASCLCDGHLTSYNFLIKLGELQKGQSILINGGAGSLGSAAIQLAKIKGARVVATASPKNFEYVKSLGADHAVDYKRLDEVNEQFDVIFDSVGKLGSHQYKRMMKESSKYLTPVLTLSVLLKMMMSSLLKTKKRVIFSATGLLKPEVLKEYLAEILLLFKDDKIKAPIEKCFDLNEIKYAHKDIESGHKRANYVLVFS